jgi:hypothetical protein
MTDTPESVVKQLTPQHSTEAPCSANVKARIGGYDWQITCRSHVDHDDLLNMAKSIKWWNAWLDKEAAQNVKATADAINIERTTVTATTTPPPPPPPGGATQTVSGMGGTFRIAKMTVTPRTDGKIELAFFEAGHQYADIKAIKGVAECIALLHSTGGWTVDHFKAIAEYPVNMLIDWKPSDNLNKNGKPYKNIVTVSPA